MKVVDAVRLVLQGNPNAFCDDNVLLIEVWKLFGLRQGLSPDEIVSKLPNPWTVLRTAYRIRSQLRA